MECRDRQCKDMDLAMAMQYGSPGGARKQQKTMDSQEFDFKLESGKVAAADELFYKGQLLPLQPDPRLQLVQILSSPKHDSMDSRCSSFRSQSSGYWDSTTSRDSNGSSQDSSCINAAERLEESSHNSQSQSTKRNSFSLKSFFHGLKSVKKKMMMAAAERPNMININTSTNYKEVWHKYVKKLKPLYAKMGMDKSCGRPSTVKSNIAPVIKCCSERRRSSVSRLSSNPWKQNVSFVASCPASMASSPNHSGVLTGAVSRGMNSSSSRELESAIQGAIAHCKESHAGKISPKLYGRPAEMVTHHDDIAIKLCQDVKF